MYFSFIIKKTGLKMFNPCKVNGFYIIAEEKTLGILGTPNFSNFFCLN